MGLLVDGVWHHGQVGGGGARGRFVRTESAFRAAVAAGGPFPPAASRYHLYVADACPWAHRTTLVRVLKGLESVVSVSRVSPDMLEEGWVFDAAHPDPLRGRSRLHEVYTEAMPTYTGKVTVPVLWDTLTNTVVNNESSEIIRFLDGPLSPLGRTDALAAGWSLRPVPLVEEIDAVNARIYETLNNGVYRCGFARSQEAYEEAVVPLFETLDWLEERLTHRRWLVGDAFTEADVRLFTTLYRFDPVYFGHFKCSRRRLQDYPQLWHYTRAIYQLPGVAETCDLSSICRHYHFSHPSINPHQIVPLPPDIDYDQPADRGPLRP